MKKRVIRHLEYYLCPMLIFFRKFIFSFVVFVVVVEVGWVVAVVVV